MIGLYPLSEIIIHTYMMDGWAGQGSPLVVVNEVMPC